MAATLAGACLKAWSNAPPRSAPAPTKVRCTTSEKPSLLGTIATHANATRTVAGSARSRVATANMTVNFTVSEMNTPRPTAAIRARACRTSRPRVPTRRARRARKPQAPHPTRQPTDAYGIHRETHGRAFDAHDGLHSFLPKSRAPSAPASPRRNTFSRFAVTLTARKWA